MRRFAGQGGFTLIELAVVCMVIGILAAIAVPNYARTKARAGRASCVSNQRNLYLATVTYTGDQGILNGVITSADLFAAGAAPSVLTDCPDELDASHDDYEITLDGGEITDVQCTVFPGEHVWEP
jgi:prepilin-type N-terminal cleavage/methylation domain-containing protein